MAGLDTGAFMQSLGQLGIAVIDYDPTELTEELAALT